MSTGGVGAATARLTSRQHQYRLRALHASPRRDVTALISFIGIRTNGAEYITFRCGLLNFYLREAPRAEGQQHDGDVRERGRVRCDAEVGHADERAAHAVHAVSERVDARPERERLWQIRQRGERA